MKIENIRKSNIYTYQCEVITEHWYYGTTFRDYTIDFSDDIDTEGDEAVKEALKLIIKNDIDFKYINWDSVKMIINYVFDNQVIKKEYIYED